MDTASLAAIDVHVHVEGDGHGHYSMDDELLAASAAYFRSGDERTPTVEQIAAAAGMAKPTLYHYFRAKDEILRGIHETFIDLLLERQDERERLGLAPADLLLGAMTDIFGLMETHRGHVRVSP